MMSLTSKEIKIIILIIIFEVSKKFRTVIYLCSRIDENVWYTENIFILA